MLRNTTPISCAVLTASTSLAKICLASSSLSLPRFSISESMSITSPPSCRRSGSSSKKTRTLRFVAMTSERSGNGAEVDASCDSPSSPERLVMCLIARTAASSSSRFLREVASSERGVSRTCRAAGQGMNDTEKLKRGSSNILHGAMGTEGRNVCPHEGRRAELK
eukprot:scaffold122303_cov40-Tisochrysis_lutea.AAC.3